MQAKQRTPLKLSAHSDNHIINVMREDDIFANGIIDNFLRDSRDHALFIPCIKKLHSMNIRGSQVYPWYVFMARHVGNGSCHAKVLEAFHDLSIDILIQLVEYVNHTKPDNCPHLARVPLTVVS